jgi:hypothetical protein
LYVHTILDFVRVCVCNSLYAVELNSELNVSRIVYYNSLFNALKLFNVYSVSGVGLFP